MALIEPADVERLFRAVVTTLAEHDPGRLTAPLQVAELYQQIVPYRSYRARLGFDTHQDYEGAMLGLLAGIGGYADLEPVEARDTLAAEAASPNPDPGLVRDFAGARLVLNARRAREVLGSQSSFAPPSPPSPAAPAESPSPEPVPTAAPFMLEADERPQAAPATPPGDAAARTATTCPQCSRSLPTDRAVVFCPYCGTIVGAIVCARCGDELKPDWRFCPRCGHAPGK